MPASHHVVTRPLRNRWLRKLPAWTQRILEHVIAVFSNEPWYAEVFSSLSTLAWGTLTLLKGTDLHALATMPAITDIVSDDLWGFAAVALGAAQFLALLLDSRRLRWLVALPLCWFWGVLTMVVWSTVPMYPGVAAYAGWCAINAFSVGRLPRAGR